MKVKLFVGNLPPETSSREIRSLFEQYGKVLDCDILKNYGFVHYENEQAAEEAVRKLHHYNLHGSNIKVEPSKNPNPPSTKLHVGNLSRKCTELELRAKFEVYGPVIECNILRDFGFVHMERAEDALEAIRGLHGTEFLGKCMQVQLSTSRLRTVPGMGDSSTCYRCGKSGHWFRECPGGGLGRAMALSNQHARQYPALRMPFARASEAPVLPRGQNEALQYRQPFPGRPTMAEVVASNASAYKYRSAAQIPAQLPQVQNPAAAGALTYSSLSPNTAHLWPTLETAAASASRAASRSAPMAATASDYVRHLSPLPQAADAGPTVREGPNYGIDKNLTQPRASTQKALRTLAHSKPAKNTSQVRDDTF